jgi:CheY-like chemotaxis protein
MIEAMGGTIGVESEVGAGSRFYIELPLVDHVASRMDEEAPAAAPHLQFEASHHGTVLYVEDNLANIKLIEEILTRYPGVRLLEAMQGKLGLELANTHTPDWILLDVHLPDMSGEEVLKILRRDARTEKIPVTVLSADATAGQIRRLMSAGAREYLTKPFDVRQLIGLLEATLPAGEPAPAASRPSPRSSTEMRWAPEAVSLAPLPAGLIEELQCAVRDGQKDRLDELIAAVAHRDAQCGRALKDLADQYDYDALNNLLMEARP